MASSDLCANQPPNRCRPPVCNLSLSKNNARTNNLYLNKENIREVRG